MIKTIIRTGLIGLLISLVLSACMRDEIPRHTEFVVEPETFSFAGADFDVLPEYQVQAGDILDVLFNIQSWNPEKEYLLALGDTISVRFPGVPILDQVKVKIPPDGTIIMPYVGVVKVQGLSAQKLKETLEEKYAPILRVPEVYVTVDDYLFQLYSLKEDLRTAPRGLSRLATVRPDGFITFPLIGDVMAAQKTIPQLNAYINKEYEKISHSLQANLFLETHAASHVYVLGSVNNPGAYPIPRPVTILQAVSLAGGDTLGSDLEEVFVARRVEKRMVVRRIDVASLLSMKEDSAFFFVGPDDIVYVPFSRVTELAFVMERVREIMLFRGWSAGVGANYDLTPVRN